MTVTLTATAEPAAGVRAATADDAAQLADMLARSFESCPAWEAFLPPVQSAVAALWDPPSASKLGMRDSVYLSVLGVVPAARKAGVAEALLLPGPERCNRERRAAYTETGRPRSRDFYAEHGFEVTEEFNLPGDGPPVWRMWRAPRTED
jgi:hypothetical protein